MKASTSIRVVEWLLTLGLLSSVCLTEAASVSEETTRILAQIFDGYKKDVPPEANDNGAVRIYLSIRPLHLHVDEMSSVLHTHVWFRMSWHDSRLRWNADDFSNVSKLHVDCTRIWKPDIRSFNSVQHDDYEDTNAIVYVDGSVAWIPPVTFHTTCSFDYTFWPWDVQRCSLVMGSWTKSGEELDVYNLFDQNVTALQVGNFVPNVWTIRKAVAERSVESFGNLDVSWPDVTVYLTLQRNSYVDAKIAFLPIIVVSSLMLVIFWMHPVAPLRLHFGMLSLLLLILVLLHLRVQLPSVGGQLPLIMAFMATLIVMVTLQLLLTLTLSSLATRKDSPPALIMRQLDGVLGKALCLTNVPFIGQISSGNYVIDMDSLRISKSANNADNAGSVESFTSLESSNYSGNWLLLTKAIDRVVFVLYVLVVLIFTTSYVGGAVVAGQ